MGSREREQSTTETVVERGTDEGAAQRRPCLIYNEVEDSWAETCALSPELACLWAYGYVMSAYVIEISKSSIRHNCQGGTAARCVPRYVSGHGPSYYDCRTRAARAFTAGYDPVRLPRD